ncbi:uncharacterized protein [Lolium perenne]|uniref:uncharacterized protein n=1 Tax=Lolium perenne TaxID=4522 RepID=UPI0021E9F725|nr:uncharacterized protein LOC127316906 [Lolium perenne]
MDWYAWLSKAGLTPAATYEYGLLFSENELEPADAPDFDHDLLKSMGVAVAKHRLEILKLARKDAAAAASANSLSSSVTARLARKAGKCIARCARRLAGGGGKASTSVVPRICSSGRASTTVVPRICSGSDDVVVRAGALRQRKRGVKKMVLMITDSGVATGAGGRVRFSSGSSQKASLMFHDCAYEEDEEEEDASGGEEEQSSDGGAAAATGRGEIKWDCMFQDLKPT